MARAREREERYSHGPHADREKARYAAFEHSETEAAAQTLRWVLGLETDVDYRYLFLAPS